MYKKNINDTDQDSEEDSQVSEDTRENKRKIEELLRCFICYGKVKDPIMCPSCSKFCCNPCFKKWLTEHKSECPYCRDSLRPNQLIPLRFLNDQTYAVESIIESKVKPDENDMCEQHRIKMCYYCITCTKSICSDCAMFSEEVFYSKVPGFFSYKKQHKTHEFAHLQSVYEKNFNELKLEINVLREKIKDMEDNVNDINDCTSSLKGVREHKLKELNHLLQKMKNKLDSEIRSKECHLIEQKGTDFSCVKIWIRRDQQ